MFKDLNLFSIVVKLWSIAITKISMVLYGFPPNSARVSVSQGCPNTQELYDKECKIFETFS